MYANEPVKASLNKQFMAWLVMKKCC